VASLTDFHRVAGEVSNWGRWGDSDELGTLNFITPDKIAEAAALVKHGKVFPLGVDFGSSGPQGSFKFRHNPIHVMTVDGGDAHSLPRFGPDWAANPGAQEMGKYFQDDLFRFNDDMIIMQKLSSKWEQQTGNKINWVILEENVLRQKVTTDIATKGGQYDVVTIGAYETPIWGKKGWLTSLDDFKDYDYDDLLAPVKAGLTVDGERRNDFRTYSRASRKVSAVKPG